MNDIESFEKRKNIITVLINGNPTSGKDTFVKLCKNYAHFRTIKIDNIDSVDYIKRAADILTGEDHTAKTFVKTEKWRNLICTLKQMSYDYNRYPIQVLLNKIKKEYDDMCLGDFIWDSILFVHVREYDQIKELLHNEYLLSVGIVTTLFIEGGKEISTNTADANVLTSKDNSDVIIHNNSTLDNLNIDAMAYMTGLQTLLVGGIKKGSLDEFEKTCLRNTIMDTRSHALSLISHQIAL